MRPGSASIRTSRPVDGARMRYLERPITARSLPDVPSLTVRVLVFHGYLLHGTGSNVYNARLGAALVRAGHEVHLLSQDRDPFDQDWVDAAGNWDGGALALEARREPPLATAYRPDLGGLLPVYVPDRYDRIDA